ncbi:Hpt domain-containing response regulator [Pseudoxanthomonas indica]|uniref:Hpt domain-containing protein n=1 Tax=Pseudoxanthomonas indica TaxID=428993 RepID=A0A1T5LVT1_9GAMM|nr:response regulator [Pseudoxanthomonas indica]GGD39802.1 transcriptional regulator [Pseudoxanthomonas indica]SKC79679.1 Hpt domain-containing protein [Pseudoxanthomonas indica]
MTTDIGSPPRLLLIEDDAISRQFMQAALEALPAQVDAVETAAQALALPGPYDLWLIDAHLPDGSGADLLAELRRRHPGVPALAHTADASASKRDALLAAGFARVVVKPLSAVELQEVAHAQLPLTKNPVWDEAGALRALNGNAEHVARLRALFLDELPVAVDSVRQAQSKGDSEKLRGTLHRLRASCGFVGAHQLAQAVSRLQREPESGSAMAEFLAASDNLGHAGVEAA